MAHLEVISIFSNPCHKINEKQKYFIDFISVNPPQNFEIVDPGYLGYLYLQWQPPLAVDNFKECTIEYELKYRNVDSAIWKVSTAYTYNIIVTIKHFLLILNFTVHSKLHNLIVLIS